MARDIENVNITLPGESDTIILNVDGEPTEVTVALDNWRNADAELDADSKNAIQNRAVAEALDQKVDKVSGKGLSTNDYTDADKTKLADLPTDADLTAELAGKVDKETGKGLSTNDFTDAEKSKLQGVEAGAQVNTVLGVKGDAETDYRAGNVNITKENIGLGNVDNTSDLNKPVSTAMQTALDGKVDKVTGKGLSTNDYTTEEKNKLSGIESGAQVNTITGVKGNSETSYRTGNVNITKANIGLGNVDNTADADKPISTATQTALSGKVDKVTGKGLSTNDFTDTLKTKLNGIATGAEVNVQANWNESDRTADSFIQNKPSIPSKTSDLTNDSGFVTDAAMQSALDQKVDKVAGKGLSTKDFTSAEKTKLAGIEAGAQVNTITGVKGNAETDYRTGDVNITKANIGLGNVNNTSDLDKPISTAVQNELTALNSNLSQKVSSVNGETPDTNGNVALIAENIPADGVGSKDVSGNPIIVTDAVAENAQNLSVELEPIQSGSGTPSPTNIRPITGRTSVDVTRTGKNLCPPVTIGKSYDSNTGAETTDSEVNASSVKFPIDRDKTYVFTKNCDVNAMFFAWDAQDNYVGRTPGLNNSPRVFDKSRFVSGGGTKDFDSIAKIAVRFYQSTGQNIEDVIGAEYQIEVGDTATAYEPYVTPQSVTVNLGQTVYGGTLNVTTGKLTVKTANIASYNGETIGDPWWSSLDEYVAGATPTTGAQVVYTLATPTTVTLTPAQLALLEGYNILTTDGDNINLRYTGTVASNVQSEIDEFEESTRKLANSIAMIETSPATTNHAVGSYLMLNNRLCKVTSAIATGEQIIVGSNVSYTTVAEELAAILAQINA